MRSGSTPAPHDWAIWSEHSLAGAGSVAKLGPLCEQAVAFLENVFDEDSGLFPFSTRLEDDRYLSDFSRHETLRYTLICLCGLQKAAQYDSSSVLLREADELVERFVRTRGGTLKTHADVGLLLLLLSSLQEPKDLKRTITTARNAVLHSNARHLNMQDLSWMLWGAAACAQAGAREAESLATQIYERIRTDFIAPPSGLPRHSTRLYRRRLVSFGSLAYYLRALHAYGELTGDRQAQTLFVNGLEQAVQLQGPQGDWPWMIHADRAITLDRYPIFSVHQLSMAMLFLLPGLDKRLAGARRSINASIQWVQGQNEINTPFFVERPFFIFRSLERNEVLAKAHRYLRAIAWSTVEKQEVALIENARLRINRESRSYEWGWLLYIWAGRPDAPTLIAGSK